MSCDVNDAGRSTVIGNANVNVSASGSVDEVVEGTVDLADCWPLAEDMTSTHCNCCNAVEPLDGGRGIAIDIHCCYCNGAADGLSTTCFVSNGSK